MRRRSGETSGRRHTHWPWVLILLLLLAGTALYCGLGSLWVPAVICAMVTAADALVWIRACAGLTVLQTLSAAECTTGESVTLKLEVSAPAFFTLCTVERRLAQCTFAFGREPETEYRVLETSEASFTLRAVGVGPQYAGMQKIKIRSPLGLFSHTSLLGRCGREGPRPILILPRLWPAADPPFGAEDDRREETRRLLHTGEPDAVSGSRIYAEGEPLNRVNWKLTCARRTLYMKEYDTVGARADNTLYLAPFAPALRQPVLEAALAGGALLLRDSPILLRYGETRTSLSRGDLTALARALALLPDISDAPASCEETLRTLAEGRSCCTVVTEGSEEICRLLAGLPKGSLVITPGSPTWRKGLRAGCRAAGVNLCEGRTGEEYTWIRA